MTSGDAGQVEMLATFKEETAFVVAGNDWDDGTETAGESFFFSGFFRSKLRPKTDFFKTLIFLANGDEFQPSMKIFVG